jgi:hypothetical protein
MLDVLAGVELSAIGVSGSWGAAGDGLLRRGVRGSGDLGNDIVVSIMPLRECNPNAALSY